MMEELVREVMESRHVDMSPTHTHKEQVRDRLREIIRREF